MNQNQIITAMTNASPSWRKLSGKMKNAILSRSGENGLSGVRIALSDIFDMGNASTNPEGKPEIFGTPDDYRLFDDLDSDVCNMLRQADDPMCESCAYMSRQRSMCFYNSAKQIIGKTALIPIEQAKYFCPMVFGD